MGLDPFSDEATSSLDTKREKAIQETIYSFKGKQILIIIAHRLIVPGI
jgi:ABC-type multidrug transport system fused ATPase/permease subunit